MSNWRDLGDVPRSAFREEFARLGSPMLADADAVHAAARPHSALCLAMLWVEQKYATLSSIPTSFRNPLSLAKPDGTPEDGDDRWERYPTWAAGVTGWRERITSLTYKPSNPGVYARTVTIEELVEVYAPRSENPTERYIDQLRERLAAIPREPAMPTAKPTILLTRGHGTTGDTGAPGEEDQNKRIVPALAGALRAAGYDVTTFPENPVHDVPGTLDDEGIFANQWMARTPGAKVMIDCHLELSPARGVFAIIADGTNLVTAAPVVQLPHDTWENNAGDRALGKAFVEEINRLTGLPIRQNGVREPGLMHESQTWVGQGSGGVHLPSRLAMFGYTSSFCDSTHRLVVEFGNLQFDQDFFTAAAFPAEVGQAVVAALARVFGENGGGGGSPDPDPAPKFVKARIPAFMVEAQRENKPLPPLAKIGGVSAVLVSQRFRAVKETPVLNAASRESGKPVRPALPEHAEFDVAYAFVSHGEPWGLSIFGSRIPLDGAVPVPH